MMVVRSVWLGALAGALLCIHAVAAQGPRLLEQRESLYNNIYVTEKAPMVGLSFGHNKKFYAESIYNRDDDRELIVSYTRVMTVGLLYAKELRSILGIRDEPTDDTPDKCSAQSLEAVGRTLVTYLYMP